MRRVFQVLGLLLALGSMLQPSTAVLAACCKSTPTPAPVTPLSVQVLTDAALQAACTKTVGCPNGHAVFAQGVWRVGFTTVGDVDPTFWYAQTGACASHNYPAPYNAVALVADHGLCENSADGGSWLSVPYRQNGLDAMQFGLSSSGDGTPAIQATYNAAHYFKVGKARFPIGANYTAVYWPNDVVTECNGDANPFVRTAIGPGWTNVDEPTHLYNQAAGNALNIRDCSFNDGAGLPGTNVLLYSAGEWGHLENVHSVSSLDGVEFHGSLSGANTLTVSTIIGGNPAASAGVQYGPAATTGATGPFGMLIMCGSSGNGCVRTDITGPPITFTGGVSFARTTAQTSGAAHDTGDYTTTSFTPNVSSRPMVGVIAWNWPDAPNSPVLPSAAITLLNGVFDNEFLNLRAGGLLSLPNDGTCTTVAGAGILMEESVSGSKPNSNTFIHPYHPCARVGLLLNNGGDNTFSGSDGQFDNIVALIGGGLSNAWRNTFLNPYVEGNDANDLVIDVGFILGSGASGTYIDGQGSNNGVNTTLVDYTTSSCWNLRNPGKNHNASAASPPSQLYCSGGQLLTGANGGAIYNPATTPTVPAGMYAAEGGFWWFASKATAALGTCNLAHEGQSQWVTDSNTTTLGATVTGGGTSHILAICNSASGQWEVH